MAPNDKSRSDVRLHSPFSDPSELTPLIQATTTKHPDSTPFTQSIMKQLKQWLTQIKVPVYILVMFFAISSWIDINGLWVEVPYLVNELPEGWDLPSYLTVIIQIANIGPFCYTLANRIWPTKVKEWPFVYVIICIGMASVILMTFYWRETAIINGREHSVALFALTTCLSIVDCTSSVVYLPYMAGFKPQYMTAFYIGEGLSGLIPGLVGLLQGVSKKAECINVTVPVYNATTGENHTHYSTMPVSEPPLFSVEVFFYFLFAMLWLSVVCFTLIHFLPYSRQERIDDLLMLSSDILSQTQKGELNGIDNTSCEVISVKPYGASDSNSEVIIVDKPPCIETMKSRDDDGRDPTQPTLIDADYALLLLLCAWASGLTSGVVPSTQSYACLPYGNNAYTLAVRLSTVANPLACFVALFVASNSVTVLSALSAAGTSIVAFQLYLAAMSPSPPLQGEVGGEVMVILSSVTLTGLFSYVKVSIASTIMGRRGRKGLLWVGVATQVGSLFAAVITFCFVTIVKVFESMPSQC